MATLLISCTLVLVVFAAFQPAPATGKYGAIAGISLLVFSVLQLITFCLMAAYIKKCETRETNPFASDTLSFARKGLFSLLPTAKPLSGLFLCVTTYVCTSL